MISASVRIAPKCSDDNRYGAEKTTAQGTFHLGQLLLEYKWMRRRQERKRVNMQCIPRGQFRLGIVQ